VAATIAAEVQRKAPQNGNYTRSPAHYASESFENDMSSSSESSPNLRVSSLECTTRRLRPKTFSDGFGPWFAIRMMQWPTTTSFTNIMAEQQRPWKALPAIP